jgi:hypothetical protein
LARGAGLKKKVLRGASKCGRVATDDRRRLRLDLD